MIPFNKFTTVGTAEPSSLALSSLAGLELKETRTNPKEIRVLIVGAGTVGQDLARSLHDDGRYRVVGYADDDMETAALQEGIVLGRKDEVPKLVEDYVIDEVYVAYAPTWQQRMVEHLTTYHPGVQVHVVPSPYESLINTGTVQSMGDIALVRLTSGERKIREATKRAFDFMVAFIALVLFAPLLLAVALLIKLCSPGPAIFAQERVGRYGKTFTLFKFRTMVMNAEAGTGPVLANGKNDPRLTWLGRWLRLLRIDEIPQLWNVLLGEMSLVGPRPERPYFVQKYERSTPAYARRHTVRPGITGLAQVLGGYHTDPRDKLRFDLIYTTHQSFWLDLSILFRTFAVVLLPQRYSWERKQKA
jgi:exopolysaccharide biosynthesis polyprenyl glycosylphosphotransferase